MKGSDMTQQPNLDLAIIVSDITSLLKPLEVKTLTYLLDDLAKVIQHGAGVVEGLGYVLGSIKSPCTPLGLMELARALENEAKEKLKKPMWAINSTSKGIKPAEFPYKCGEQHINGTICFLTEGHGGKHTGYHLNHDAQFTWPLSPSEKSQQHVHKCGDKCLPYNEINGVGKENWCNVLAPKGKPGYCSLPKGHLGDHVACDNEGCGHDLSVWPQEHKAKVPKCKYAIINKDGSKEECIKSHNHLGDHESGKGETWG